MLVSYFAVDLCGDFRYNRLLKFCETDFFLHVCVKWFLPGEMAGLKEQRFRIDLRKQSLRLMRYLKRASCVDTMSRTQHPEWYC